jgi:hypothetical protein
MIFLTIESQNIIVIWKCNNKLSELIDNINLSNNDSLYCSTYNKFFISESEPKNAN